MATCKATITALEQLAGDLRGRVRGSWAAPSGKVSVAYRASKGGSVKTYTYSAASCVEEYQIRWSYTILVSVGGDRYQSRWVYGDWKTVSRYTLNDVFSVPDGATDIVLEVWAVPQEYDYYPSKSSDSTSKGKYFTPGTVRKQVQTGAQWQPEMPEISSVKVADDGLTIEVKLKDDDPYTWRFEAQGNNGAISGTVATKLNAESYGAYTYADEGTVLLKGKPGTTYSIRARMCNLIWHNSPWTYWSGTVKTKPARASGVSAKATADGCAAVTWAAAAGADWYEVAYANSPKAFSLSSGYKTLSTKDRPSPAARTVTFDDLDVGKSWFFWVRGCNDSGDGDWSAASPEIRLGTAPTAPSVWADSYACIRGEAATVRWQHNATDGSDQRKAEVWYSTGGAFQKIDVPGATSEAAVPTGAVPDGGLARVYVRTYGIADAASPSSETIAIGVWERPACAVQVNPEIGSYPVAVAVETDAGSQTCVEMSLRIVAAEDGPATAPDGTERQVRAGDEVWSATLAAPQNPLDIALTPGDVALSDGGSYELRAVCAMSSGLSCEAAAEFSCDFADLGIFVQGAILPHGRWGCEVVPSAYVVPEVDTTPAWGRPVESDAVAAPDVLLSVYRCESDGSMTKLLEGAPNDGTYSLVDPHAPLGRQTYRIVATSVETGAIAYDDVSDSVVAERCLLIQWEADPSVRPWADGDPESPSDGATRTLWLPYGTEVSDDNDKDVELVAYLDRDHPVAYYGTQLGQTSRWNCRFPQDDEDTLELLRELAAYRGDVYVRDILGAGYWASAKPSWEAGDGKRVVEVSIDVTRTDTRDACIVITEEGDVVDRLG
ncbi:hypothetical protein [uncultured Adlercreutzia sp.]|uniref:hypothetical protein n=1 Tax=uncultured Adlercreutzia sp. TaxID=875803 RepID=UPI00266BB429|nr:hypothetical protein [uncultured Adlercreutzia sp.]